MPGQDPTIELRDVSRWYGEVLGVNRVSVDVGPGITGLVGPNGSGKSTLMNLIAGLLRPGQGKVRVFGERPWFNASIHHKMGYCTQFDNFYENFSGFEFVRSILALHGRGGRWAERTARQALDMVGLAEPASRRVRTYSKGMRQRVKIALALAHQPDLLILDEPFNGLDPVGRHDMMRLFANYAREARTVLVSSHVLHEVEQMTDRILMMSNGYVMAEGEVHSVRDQLRRHPFRVFVRCREPRRLAALLVEADSVLSVELTGEQGVSLSTRDPDGFYQRLNEFIVKTDLGVDLVTLDDENVQSVYRYLSGREHH